MSNLTIPPLTGGYIYEYRGASVVIIASVFIALQISFACLRAYSGSLQRAGLGADDVLLWASLVVIVALDVYCIALVKFGGAGRHVFALQFLGEGDTIALWTKMILGIEWVYFLAVCLPKLCILTLYLRIFNKEPLRATCYSMATIIICNFLVSGLTVSLACPVLSYFSAMNGGASCSFNMNYFTRWISVPNIITDVVMLILPLPTIWELHLPKIQKLGLTLTFLMGSIGLIASCFRFRSFFVNFIPDPIFSSADLMIWTIIEPGMYFIAACFLRLRPLLQKLPTSAWLQLFLRRQTPTRRLRPREGDNAQAREAGESRGIRSNAYHGRRQDSDTNQTYSRDVTLSSTCVGSERSKEDNIEMEYNAMVTTIMD
ncbi:hypothetical protein LARI1_G007366 [Lachnellula arida]|uniref:Rhodopsin domain-containing protein n=1 Tax=Lachnellula arida TaxID=1316785 RepID=A0A8T9BGB1_9HELO|nr:hypothetical protein LARI1_G007366 [Lachnellula arida]